MEKVIVVINGTYAKEKAKAIREMIMEQAAARDITDVNAYVEEQLQLMPFMTTNRKGDTHGKQVCSGLCSVWESRHVQR